MDTVDKLEFQSLLDRIRQDSAANGLTDAEKGAINAGLDLSAAIFEDFRAGEMRGLNRAVEPPLNRMEVGTLLQFTMDMVTTWQEKQVIVEVNVSPSHRHDVVCLHLVAGTLGDMFGLTDTSQGPGHRRYQNLPPEVQLPLYLVLDEERRSAVFRYVEGSVGLQMLGLGITTWEEQLVTKPEDRAVLGRNVGFDTLIFGETADVSDSMIEELRGQHKGKLFLIHGRGVESS